MTDQKSENHDSEASAGATQPTPFQILCGSLGAQVHMALGLIADPVTKETTVEMDVAQQGIGLIAMLEEKTRGNLTDVEGRTLGNLLTQLRMLYIQRLKLMQEPPEEEPTS